MAKVTVTAKRKAAWKYRDMRLAAAPICQGDTVEMPEALWIELRADYPKDWELVDKRSDPDPEVADVPFGQELDEVDRAIVLGLFTALDGITPGRAEVLVERGYRTIQHLLDDEHDEELAGLFTRSLWSRVKRALQGNQL